MQTFCAYADLYDNFKCMDYQRLGKQRVECKQIYLILKDSKYMPTYNNHPAVLQWKGYESALIDYAIRCCSEWKMRGYQDTLFHWFRKLPEYQENPIYPWWWGNNDLHQSHRARLYQKNKVFYSSFKEDDKGQGYIWGMAVPNTQTKLNA
jgi:hypothetical protein